MIVQWILDSWKELDEEIIVKSFKARALNLNVDGSKDKSIYCLIKDLPCKKDITKKDITSCKPT